MTTVTLGKRFFARWYPRFMAGVERAGQADLRRAQLAEARGRTLEIGAGNGLSVPHYPDNLDELVLLEPNPAMRTQLAARTDTPAGPVTIVDGDAHHLLFPDASFDTVTASLVFCSVTDPVQALREVHRVLRPGGQFLFHEHVRGTGVRAAFQDLLTPVQRRLADGCHANRDFESLLETTQFDIETIEHTRMPTTMPTIVPLVVGTARKAGGDTRGARDSTA